MTINSHMYFFCKNNLTLRFRLEGLKERQEKLVTWNMEIATYQTFTNHFDLYHFFITFDIYNTIRN